MPSESIYDDPGRLAHPDEVWNYGRGDGVEKAVVLANVLHQRRPTEALLFAVEPQRVLLKCGDDEFRFDSSKGLKEQVWPLADWLDSSPRIG